MKRLFAVILFIVSINGFAHTVVDSLYEQPDTGYVYRDPASNKAQYCIVDDKNRIFGKSCYSSEESCAKRFEFWKDLPGVKPNGCVKIQ